MSPCSTRTATWRRLRDAAGVRPGASIDGSFVSCKMGNVTTRLSQLIRIGRAQRMSHAQTPTGSRKSIACPPPAAALAAAAAVEPVRGDEAPGPGTFTAGVSAAVAVSAVAAAAAAVECALTELIHRDHHGVIVWPAKSMQQH
jgi:hypothetical protein